jgi:hypothetical protein
MKDMSPEEQLEMKLEALGRALRGLEGAAEWLAKHAEIVPGTIYPVLVQEVENKVGYALTLLRNPGKAPERTKGSFADAVLSRAAAEEKPAKGKAKK